jgi:ApbE family
MLELRELPGEVLGVRFSAMASPCELLLGRVQRELALELGSVAAAEAHRIEQKFSRYREDSVPGWIHRHRGAALQVDEETALLLDFAQQCFELSDGLFDITSGPLRRVWQFDGSDRVPAPEAVAQLLPCIGFQKLSWKSPWLCVPPDMALPGAVSRQLRRRSAGEPAAAAWTLEGRYRATRLGAHGGHAVGSGVRSVGHER